MRLNITRAAKSVYSDNKLEHPERVATPVLDALYMVDRETLDPYSLHWLTKILRVG